MNKLRSIFKRRKAFTLIEVLVGLTIFTLFVSGTAYLAVDTINQDARDDLRIKALAYAEEGLEATRSIRDVNYWALVDGSYGLSRSATAWSFAAAPETVDSFYERTITVSPVYRDASGNIASSGTLDTLIKKINSRVEWTWRGVFPQSVELTTYLSNWRGDAWLMTTCTEFSAGTYDLVEAEAASSPPADNCMLSLTLAEQLGTFYHSVDMGTHGDDVAVSGNRAYVAANNAQNGLDVVDLTDPASTTITASLDVGAKGRTVLLSGTKLYMGVDKSSAGLVIVDVASPDSPVLKSSTNIGGYGNRMAKSGNYLYVTSESTTNSFMIYDVTSSTAPVQKSQFNMGSSSNVVQVSGNYAYVGTSSSTAGFRVLNVSNPLAPTSTATLNLGAGVRSIVINGSLAYVGLNTTSNSLKVVNISNPAAPAVLATLSVGAIIQDMEMSDDFLYLALDQINPGMVIANISTPAAPYVSFNVDVGGKGTGVTVSNSYAYVTLDVNNKGLVVNGQASVSVANTGTYISPAFDTGSVDTRYNYLDWSLNQVAGSTVTFQIRTADTAGNLSTATWIGPDGTAATTFGTAPASITLSPTRTGQRWVQVRATLTSDGTNSSSIDYFKLDYQP